MHFIQTFLIQINNDILWLFNTLSPLIIKYQHLISFVSILFVLLFALLLFRIEKKKNQKNKANITTQEMQMLASEDFMTSQLDLARAYVAMGKQDLAKPILKKVTKTGNKKQKAEAACLIETL